MLSDFSPEKISELREELRDLIVRKFQFTNKLAIKEVVELLNGIPELTGLSVEDLAFEGTEVTADRTIGFCRITKKGRAQQVRVNIDWLAKVAKFLSTLKDVGFDSVVVTVQEGKPMIIGGKEIGIGIAPRDLEE